MRTTLSLAPDVAAAVDKLRRDEGMGVGEAVNHLARAGTTHMAEASRVRTDFRLDTAPMGARVSLDNVGDVLDMLDEN